MRFSLAYILILLTVLFTFSFLINRYLVHETQTDILADITGTLEALQESFDARLQQMTAISVYVWDEPEFRSGALTNYSYAYRTTIQKRLLAYCATGQYYSDIAYYNADFPGIVFTTAGTRASSMYKTFLDADTGEWLCIDALGREQLNGRWYAADENHDLLSENGAAILYCLPVPNSAGGYLIFEMRETDISRSIPPLQDNSSVLIGTEARQLYPIAETAQSLCTGKDDAIREYTLVSRESGLHYTYLYQADSLIRRMQQTMFWYLLLIVLIGAGSLLAILAMSHHQTQPLERMIDMTGNYIADDIRGLARLQAAMHLLDSYSQQIAWMRLNALQQNVLIRLIRGRYPSADKANEALAHASIIFRQPWRVILLLQSEGENRETIVSDIFSKLASEYDFYSFSYAELSVTVLLLGIPENDVSTLLSEIRRLITASGHSASEIHFAAGNPFTSITGASDCYMEALYALRTGKEISDSLIRSDVQEKIFFPKEELSALEESLADYDRSRVSFLYDILTGIVQKQKSNYLFAVTVLAHMIRIYENALGKTQGTDAAVTSPEDMLHYLHQLHCELKPLLLEKEQENAHAGINAIAEYITSAENLQDLTVGGVAEHFNISPSSLSHRFKEQMNCNISDYITSCKMNRACVLLRSTDLPIAEIATQIGYSQYASFVRQFKRVKGIIPSAYRNEWRQPQE